MMVGSNVVSAIASVSKARTVAFVRSTESEYLKGIYIRTVR